MPDPTQPAAPAAREDQADAPPRRSGRWCGWENKPAFDAAAMRLRAALTRLARDPDPAARRTGVALSEECAEFMSAMATRADNATTTARRAEQQAARLSARLDQIIGRTSPR